MFSRKRAHSNPPPKTPPTAAALTAAGQAFLANRASNASLSSAAAAAALRSHTTSPTPVGEIQTRRMIQRRGSASSNGSARPGLQRRDSGGSMTERTFREPSPNRNPSTDFRYDDAPPVPALPTGYMSPPPLPAKSNRRAASVERPPERVLSPPPLTNGRGVSLDRGPGMMPSQLKVRTKARSAQSSNTSQVDQGPNRESVNFSRPMSPVSSPPTSPLVDRRVASPKPPASKQQSSSSNAPNVGRLRNGEIENIQYNLQEVAQAPVKKKKKVPRKTEGSYLANGANRAGTSDINVQSTPQRQQASTESTPSPVDPNSQGPNVGAGSGPLRKKKKKIIRATEPQHSDLAYGSYASDSDSAVSDRSAATDRSRTYNTRAAGLLAKQPSIVREDPEAEEQGDFHRPTGKLSNPYSAENATLSTTSPTKAAKKATRNIPTHTKQSSLDIPRTNNDNEGGIGSAQPTRQQSLSPARAAHFSAQPILETPDNLKHQPPARSISPVKSALKHSPSRGPSPVAGTSMVGNRRRGPASEASDTTSMISDDGSKALPKKKKSVRVSFDSESVVVGRAATPPTDTDSPMIMSPQNREASTRRWLGLGKEHDYNASNMTKDQDTAIQPTPLLPSFGSVRGQSKKEPALDRSHTPSETYSPATDLGVSSDQRVGAILSRVFGSEGSGDVTRQSVQQTSNDPVPPEVTSVEGTGYHSDSGDSTSSGQHPEVQSKETTVPTNVKDNDLQASQESSPGAPSASTQLTTQSHSNEVPSIAVQPATPALGVTPSIAVQPATPGLEDIQKVMDQYWFDMPGGFPIASEYSAHEQLTKSTDGEHYSPDSTPATSGIAEPEPEAIAVHHQPGVPAVGEVAEGLRIQTEPNISEESDHTNDSIYSDAAEDLSDLEGDGFGSINAIVESPASPAVNVASKRRSETPTKSTGVSSNQRTIPLNRNESELSEPGSEAGWDKAQAYWSGLSQSRKQQIERAAARGNTIEDVQGESKPRPKKRKNIPKNTRPDTSQSLSDQQNSGTHAGPSSNRDPAKATAKSPVMRSSMRNMPPQSPQEPHMRSSMRGSAPAKSSLRASLPPETTSAPQGALQKKIRPLSAMSPSDYKKPQAREINGHDRSASLGIAPKNPTSVVAAKTKAKPSSSKPVGRTLSNGSDSSSSFKKARPKTSEGGRYTMKRSMRGSSVDEGPLPAHGRTSSMTSRTSLPVDTTRRPFSSAGPGMRSSLRESADLSKSNRTKSPSRFPGFGKSSKAKTAAKRPTSGFSSRFADSSDEDDGPIQRRSRFADSSDEDEPAGLTPVRGIPRRIDEGDSTDLEDSSADEKATTQTSKSPTQQSTRLEGAALGAGSLRTIPEASISPTNAMGTGLQAKRAAEKEKKKRSFFGSLGSKKTPKSEPLTLPTEGKQPQQDVISSKPGRPLDASPPNVPGSPQSPKQQKLLGPSTPGAVDTETSAIAGKSPKSPKLQRRISAQQAEKIQMKRGMSDSWPLPQSPGGTSTPNMRPGTSDGTPRAKNGTIGLSGLSKELRADRPGLGDRQNTVETTATGGTNTVKKKKGWFKKAFGR